MTIPECLQSIRHDFENLNKKIHEKSERNLSYMKVMATVKCSLENIFKRKADPADTIIECINLLRSETPHYSANAEKTVIDPELTEEEKNKIKELFSTN